MQKNGAALRAVQEDSIGGADAPPPLSAVPLPQKSAGGTFAASKPPRPVFEPVPRRYRHDGWTPERQKAFIEALADTGCVTRAAGMAQANCYALRRAPGAEERPW